LVNRGPHSLEVLRYVRSLGERAITVLGNHDLHLIAVALGGRKRRRDTIDDVLAAPDRDDLMAWLCTRPLMHWEENFGLLVHAGLLPQWDLAQALKLAREAEAILAGDNGPAFLRYDMYGNEPAAWSEELRGRERLRVIINACTRLRYCAADGSISMDFKGK